MKTHEYKVVNASHYKNIEEAANHWAYHGWRVVGWRVMGVISPKGSGYADELVLERPITQATEESGVWVAYHSDWSGFALFNEETDALRYANDNYMSCARIAFGVDARQSQNNDLETIKNWKPG